MIAYSCIDQNPCTDPLFPIDYAFIGHTLCIDLLTPGKFQVNFFLVRKVQVMKEIPVFSRNCKILSYEGDPCILLCGLNIVAD